MTNKWAKLCISWRKGVGKQTDIQYSYCHHTSTCIRDGSKVSHHHMAGEDCHVRLWFSFYAVATPPNVGKEKLHWALPNYATCCKHSSPCAPHGGNDKKLTEAWVPWRLTSAFGYIGQLLHPLRWTSQLQAIAMDMISPIVITMTLWCLQPLVCKIANLLLQLTHFCSQPWATNLCLQIFLWQLEWASHNPMVPKLFIT